MCGRWWSKAFSPLARGENCFVGRTRGHRKVVVPASERLVGELVDVHIRRATASTLTGDLVLEGVGAAV